MSTRDIFLRANGIEPGAYRYGLDPQLTYEADIDHEAVDLIMEGHPQADATIADALVEASGAHGELMAALESIYRMAETPSHEEWRKLRIMLHGAIRRGVAEYIADQRRRSVNY